VGHRDRIQLVGGLGQGHIEAGLPSGGSLEEELQSGGGLAGAGIALDQVQAVSGETAAEDVVQPGNAGLRAVGGASGRGSHGPIVPAGAGAVG